MCSVLLCATGSVATVKVPELAVRLLEIAEVRVVLSQSADFFFGRAKEYNGQAWACFEAAGPCIQVLRDEDEWKVWNVVGDRVVHIELKDWADVMLVAPLSANSLAKLANGLSDNLLTCTARAWNVKKPLIFAPAMNTDMWDHPITAKHLQALSDLGYHMIPPVSKKLACGVIGAFRTDDLAYCCASTNNIDAVCLLGNGGLAAVNDIVAFACIRKLDQRVASSAGSTPWAQFDPPSDILDNVKLHDYQLVGVRWLLERFHQGLNTILGDEMGLGKTLQVISFLASLIAAQPRTQPKLDPRCFLVVAPLSVLPNWTEQFARFAPSIDVFMFAEQKKDRKTTKEAIAAVADDKPAVVVTSYEMLMFDVAFFKSIYWNVMVLDEGHRLKNPKGKLYGIMAADFTKVRKVALTGTPIQNSLQELHALLALLNPDIFTDRKAFEDVFSDVFSAKAQQISLNKGDANATKSERMLKAEEMMTQILSPLLLLRTVQDVNNAFTLPPISETVVHAPMSPMQREYYKEIVARNSDVINQARSGRGSQVTLINVLPQLRKACNHPYMFPGAEPEPFCEGSHLYENSGKLYLLHNILPRLRDEGHCVLLFSQSTAYLDIVQDYLTFEGFSYERIDGSIRGKERWQAIERFRQSPETFVFLISTRSGGVGLNLQRADTVIFMDSDFNPQADLQAVARAYRLGQTKPIHVIKFMCANTVEEIIYRRSLRKIKMADKIRNCARQSDDADENEDDNNDDGSLVDLIQFGLHKLLDDNGDDGVDLTKPMEDDHITRMLARHAVTAPGVDKVTDELEAAGGDVAEDNMYFFEGEDYSKSDQRNDDEKMLQQLAKKALGGSTRTRLSGNRRPRYADDNSVSEDSVDEEQAIADEKERAEQREARRAANLAKKLEMWKKNKYESYAIDDDAADDSTSSTVDFSSTNRLYFKAGDASRPPVGSLGYDACIIVHCVDNSGVWCDRGFFRSLSNLSRQPQRQYEAAARNGDLKLGQAHLIPVEASIDSIPTYVCLLVVQGFQARSKSKKTRTVNGVVVRDGKSSTFRMNALDNALRALGKRALELNASIHMPRIGYGTPQFNWYAVERIIKRRVRDVGLHATVYYYARRAS
ncbi:TPA: hypothetical protein N0F65_010055 [Lagenidium giganteum]|uniref:Uncharacterized protein n=1 Tax=Lagenidium giganteum TaxID=4803 RepID=A0AAV2ZHZ1_9STRA|nr:TPA: hypothetical protein N0F65_010055 [Lagenidium giganteum]